MVGQDRGYIAQAADLASINEITGNMPGECG